MPRLHWSSMSVRRHCLGSVSQDLMVTDVEILAVLQMKVEDVEILAFLQMKVEDLNVQMLAFLQMLSCQHRFSDCPVDQLQGLTQCLP